MCISAEIQYQLHNSYYVVHLNVYIDSFGILPLDYHKYFKLAIVFQDK